MPNLRIIDLPSGSLNPNQLTFIGDPVSGSLSNVSFAQLQGYFASNTGSLATTASLNAVSASLVNLSSSVGSLTGSYVSTGSFNTFTSSLLTEVSNVYASESNYTPTSSFTALSSSLVSLSSSLGGLTYVSTGSFQTYTASISAELAVISNTGSLQTTASYLAYSSSANATILNVFASESNYTSTASFNTFSSSVATQVSQSVSSSYAQNAGFYSAAHFGIGATGDQTAALNTVFSSSGVNGLIFDYNSPTAISISGSVNAQGKSLIFKDGNSIVGSGSISNGIYDAGYRQNIFASSISHTGSKCHSDKVSVMWFGAKGDRSQDDQPSLQRASDTIIASTTLPTELFVPQGQYLMNEPWILYSWNGTAYQQVNINIIGEHNVQASPLTNCARLQPSYTSSFGIGVMRGTGGSIRGISVEGSFTTNMSAPQWFSQSVNYDSIPGTGRDSPYSPFSGIVIDPFSMDGIGSNDGGYPGYNSGSAVNWYRGNNPSGGTTEWTIAECNIQGFTVGVMNSPSGNTQQGEDCSVLDCQIGYCKIAIAYGQAQSDRCIIRGLKCWYWVGCVVDTSTYGLNAGNVAVIEDVNIAGFVRQFVSIGIQKVTCIKNVYSEQLLEIGLFEGGSNAGSMENCNFDLYLDGSGLEAQQHFGFTGITVSNCRIRYYDDLFNKRVRGTAENCRFIGCFFDRPPLLIGEYVSASPNARFEDCVIGEDYYMGMHNDIGVLGDASYPNIIPHGTFTLQDSVGLDGETVLDAPLATQILYTWTNATYNRYFPTGENYNLTTNTVNYTASFTSSFTELMQVNDYLWDHATTNVLGRVSAISGNLVTLSEVPLNFTASITYSGSYDIVYYLSVGAFNFIGDIVNSSATVSNAAALINYFPPVGTRIDHPSFPGGTYIQGFSTAVSGAYQVYLSYPSFHTATRQNFINGNPSINIRSEYSPLASTISNYTRPFATNTTWTELIGINTTSPSVAAVWQFNKGGFLNAASSSMSSSMQADFSIEPLMRLNSNTNNLEYYIPYLDRWTGSAGTYAGTSSYNTFTSSVNTQLANIYASESNYLSTASFNTFSSSYVGTSASLVSLIAAITGSGGGVGIVQFNTYTSSQANLIGEYALTSSIVNIGTLSGSGVTNHIAVWSGSTFVSSAFDSTIDTSGNLTAFSVTTLSSLVSGGGMKIANGFYYAWNSANSSILGQSGSGLLSVQNGTNATLPNGILIYNNSSATGSNATVGFTSTPGAFEILTTRMTSSANIPGIKLTGNGVGIATGPTTASNLNLGASTTGLSALNFSTGSAPTSPNNGDVWFDTTGSLKIFINGQTKTFTLQ